MQQITFPTISGLPLKIYGLSSGPFILYLEPGSTLHSPLKIGDQSFSAELSIDSRNRFVEFRLGSSNSPLTGNSPLLFDGQLRLNWLTLRVEFPDDSFIVTSLSQVSIIGQSRWVAVEGLGFSPNVVLLDLGWSGNSLTLEFPEPVTWGITDLAVSIPTGSKAVITDLSQATPPAIMISINSGMSISNDTMIREQLKSAIAILSQLFENSKIENLLGINPGELMNGTNINDTAIDKANELMKSFKFRRKILLNGGSGVTGDLDWSFSFDIDLQESLGEVNLPTLGTKLFCVGMGRLSISVTGEGADHTTVKWSVRFQDGTIGFPAIAGLEIPTLRGHLSIASNNLDITKILEGTQGVDFKFRPAAMQPVVLPDILKFLLGKLEWLAGEFDLDSLAEIFNQTFDERELLDFLFNNLDPVATNKEEILNDWIHLIEALPGYSTQDVFYFMFSALSRFNDKSVSEKWMQVAWKVLGDLITGRSVLLSAFVAELMRKIEATLGDIFPLVAHTLFLSAKSINLKLELLFSEIAKLTTGALHIRLEDMTKLFTKMFGIAIDAFSNDEEARKRLAKSFFDLLDDTSIAGEFKITGLRFPGDDEFVSIPLIHGLLGQTITSLGLGIPGLLPKVGWESLPGLDSTFQSKLNELRGSIEIPGAVLVGFISTLIDVADPVGIIESVERKMKIDNEWRLLNFVSQFPVAGLVLIPGSLYRCLTRPEPFSPFTKLATTRLSDFVGSTDPSHPKVDRLGPDRKYLILSDIHRDTDGDDEGRLMFGSIDHFKDNRKLYRQVLKYALDNDYTVIENGDCEELWFIKEAYEYAQPKDKLKQIINDNKAIYFDLWMLHEQGRYYKVIGNHDSYVRELMSADDGWSGYAAEIKTAAEKWIDNNGISVTLSNDPALVSNFELYDYLIIDGVKTMDEHGLGDLIKAAKETDSTNALELLISGKLGMDASEYTENKPMIVCHGHQFDFWNCDENAILGKLISNTVAVPADKLTDPLLDLKGIALSGSPLIDFRSIIANAPVINNWLAESSALHIAHNIKHQKDTSRVPINDVFFQETVAILIGNLFMDLDQKRNARDSRVSRDHLIPDPNELENGDENEKDSEFLGIELDEKWALFKFERNNHLCLGHTHYSQSQPYVIIPAELVGPLKPIISIAVTQLRRILPSFGFVTENGDFRLPIKSNYFNTGVSSWNKGVVWGVEIAGEGETDDWNKTVGQAKSVFFTENSKEPEYMDWELDTMHPDVRAALPSPSKMIQLLENINASARRWLGDRFEDVMRLNLGNSLSAPLSTFLLLDRNTNNLGTGFTDVVSELGLGSSQEDRERVAGELDSLYGELIRLVSTILQRATGINISGSNTFTFSVPLGDTADSMTSIMNWSQELFPNSNEATRFATLCFHSLGNLPILGRDPTIMTDGLRSFQGKAPLLSAFMALATLLPIVEDQDLINNVKLTTTMNISSGTATLRVIVTGGAS